MIRFIVETIESRRDIHGNCYHYATVTSIKTGRHLQFITGGDSNARALLRQMGLEWEELHCYLSEVPKRIHNRLVQGIKLYEGAGNDAEIIKQIRALEV